VAFAVRTHSARAPRGIGFSVTMGQSLKYWHAKIVLGGSLLFNIPYMPTKLYPSTAEREPHWCLWCYWELWAARHYHLPFPPCLPLPPRPHIGDARRFGLVSPPVVNRDPEQAEQAASQTCTPCCSRPQHLASFVAAGKGSFSFPPLPFLNNFVASKKATRNLLLCGTTMATAQHPDTKPCSLTSFTLPPALVMETKRASPRSLGTALAPSKPGPGLPCLSPRMKEIQIYFFLAGAAVSVPDLAGLSQHHPSPPSQRSQPLVKQQRTT